MLLFSFESPVCPVSPIRSSALALPMTDPNLLLLLILLPFLGSLLAAMLPGDARNTEAWLSGAVTIVAFAITVSLFPSVQDGEAVRRVVEWAPELGLSFSLRMDGFAWMFSML